MEHGTQSAGQILSEEICLYISVYLYVLSLPPVSF